MKGKIIDFEKKGNLVRFYIGKPELEDYWGDDWDDRPYEHNAGPVYDEFISGHIDVCFPFEALVLEPREEYAYHENSPWSKEDMQKRAVPCIVALRMIPDQYGYTEYWNYEGHFTKAAMNEHSEKFYFGDSADEEDLRKRFPGTLVFSDQEIFTKQEVDELLKVREELG